MILQSVWFLASSTSFLCCGNHGRPRACLVPSTQKTQLQLPTSTSTSTRPHSLPVCTLTIAHSPAHLGLFRNQVILVFFLLHTTCTASGPTSSSSITTELTNYSHNPLTCLSGLRRISSRTLTSWILANDRSPQGLAPSPVLLHTPITYTSRSADNHSEPLHRNLKEQPVGRFKGVVSVRPTFFLSSLLLS